MKNKHLKALIITALLAAASIVLGKFLAINIGDTIRISFESLPIILASLLFGPLYGAACGIAADVLGCVLRGYALIPLITVASSVIGIIPGLLMYINLTKRRNFNVAISVFAAHIIGSMIIKTLALMPVYHMSLWVLLSTRVPVYLVTAAVESYICIVLMNRKFIQKEIMLNSSSDK